MSVSAVPPEKKKNLVQSLTIWLDRDSTLGPVLIAPAAILLIVLIAYPFVSAIYLFVTNRVIARPDTGQFIWSRNYAESLKDSIFIQTTVIRSIRPLPPCSSSSCWAC